MWQSSSTSGTPARLRRSASNNAIRAAESSNDCPLGRWLKHRVAEIGWLWDPSFALSPVARSAANDRLTYGDFGSQPLENSLTRGHSSAFNVVSSLDSGSDKSTHGH
jgi:hypothetical protein